MASGERARGRRDADRILIVLLANGSTLSQAAQSAHCSVSTVRRRLDDWAFRIEVDAERNLLVDSLRGRLVDASTRAVATLLDVAENGQSESARVTASRGILDLTVGRRREVVEPSEMREIVGRIARLAVDRLERLDPAEARAFFSETAALLNP